MKERRRAPRRRWPRIWLGVLGGLVAVMILAFLLVPVFISSRGFTRIILGKIDRSTGGKATIGDLSMGWWKGIRIADFSFRDGAGWTAINIKEIAAQPRLTALLGGNLALGQTVIDRPKVEIDLRNRPAQRAAPGSKSPGMSPLPLTGDIVVNDGSVRLTDPAGKTVEIAQINSRVSVRPPGQQSSLEVDMVVADAAKPGQIRAAGQITPQGGKHGWTLKGTTGEFIVEVNDLNVESLGSILALAGVDVRGKGVVSGNAKTTVVDGQLQDMTTVVRGTNLDVTGEPLKGDRLQTSVLNVEAELKRKGETFQINKLEATSDWASVTATGVVPMTVKSLADLLQSDSAYDVKGQFDCDLAALLSQMPNTFGLKEGMQVTAGRANGTVTTTTRAGRAAIVTQANVVGLVGVVDGKKLTLSEPIVANLKLSADEKKTQLEALDVSAAFAKITAAGDFEQIEYDGTINLAKLQAELGQFANLGPYRMAGEVASKGRVSIQPGTVGATGSASVKQLVLASADGNSVSEPAANIDFAVNFEKEKQHLSVDHIGLTGSFGNVTVKEGTVPLDKASPTPMKLNVVARDLDLQKAKPFAVLFASLPKDVELSGIAASDLTVTGQRNRYRIHTDATKIRNFRLKTPGEKPFEQEQVTVLLDLEVDPNEKAVTVEKLQLTSPQITIRRGEFKRVRQGDKTQIEGTLEGEGSGQVIGPMASVFLPEELELTGRSSVSLNFASTYPTDEPNGLLTHLDSQGRVGLGGAQYMGLHFGVIDVNVAIVRGLMNILPFKTIVNEGELRFAARADFKQKPTLLQTTGPLFLAKGIQINKETTERLLKFVNPIFANLASVSGKASFDCEKLVIPLAAGHRDAVEVVGTFSGDNLELGASGLIDQLLAAMGESLRGQRLTIRPTKILVRNGMVRYDNMQVDVGNNPVNFGGAIGLDGRLDMTVTLPWTLRGRTARVGQEDKAGTRISVPLKGTVDKPDLDTNRFLQQQLFKGLEELLR